MHKNRWKKLYNLSIDKNSACAERAQAAKKNCENCIKTRWISPPSFYCLAEQSGNVDFRLVLAALCDFNGVGLEIMKHIHRHLTLSVTGHLDKGCQHSGVTLLPSSFCVISWLFSRSSHFILFFSFNITKYLFPIFCSLGTILLYHSFKSLSRGFSP